MNMNEEQMQLARLLRRSYDAAPEFKGNITMILFGIRHADELRRVGGSGDIAFVGTGSASGRYATGLREGIELADYVTLGEQDAPWVL